MEKSGEHVPLDKLLEGIRFQVKGSMQIHRGGQVEEVGMVNPIHFHF